MSNIKLSALNGQGEFNLFAYFFKGNQYLKYSWEQDCVVEGYPKPLALWNLSWKCANGIDACCNGIGELANKSYFFKDDEYVRFDWDTNEADPDYPLPISNWNLPVGFDSNIDAILQGNDDKIYFFKGSQYVVYDLALDTPVEGYPRPTSDWNFPDGFSENIEAAIEGKATFSGKTYFFKGNNYLRYDSINQTFDADVQPISNWHFNFSQPSNALPFENVLSENRESFVAKVREIATRLGIQPEWLMAVMFSESGLNHRIRNSVGATGLIQFMPETIKNVLKTTPENLISISNVEQLDYVHKFYSFAGRGKIHRLTDLYLFAFYPIALGKSDDFIIGSEQNEQWVKKVRDANFPFDLDRNSQISVGEFRQFVINKYKSKIPNIS